MRKGVDFRGLAPVHKQQATTGRCTPQRYFGGNGTMVDNAQSRHPIGA